MGTIICICLGIFLVITSFILRKQQVEKGESRQKSNTLLTLGIGLTIVGVISLYLGYDLGPTCRHCRVNNHEIDFLINIDK